MTPTTAALALAAEQLRSGRRSATRTLDLNLARAIARGRMPCLAEGIAETLLCELGAAPGEGVEIAWTARAGQPPGMIERLSWCPGTPLPDLLVSCTVSAPLQD